MKRKSSVMMAVVLALAIALVVTGCGKKNGASASGLSATDIVAASAKADQNTKSAKIVGTVTMTIKGDAAKLGQSDPQTAKLFNSPITLSIDGSYSETPKAFDGTITFQLMDMPQPVTFGVRTDGTTA